MNYLHYDVNINNTNDPIEVHLDKQANVLLLDSTQYQNYRNGRAFKYYGGLVKESPTYLYAPRIGHWHLVIDLGGYPGQVRASVNVIPG